MDEESTNVKTFKYTSPHQQMFSVIETPPHYRSFSQNNTVFQDLSFSSYLKPKEPTDNSPNTTIDDTEISIFDARKYFSESNNDTKDVKKQQEPSHDLLSVPRLSSVSSVDGCGRNFRTRSFHTTPTASSEASWNSQTGLLTNPPGSVGVSLRNFSSDKGKKKKWSFGRKCCCTGKKSVQVKEIVTSDSEHRGPGVMSRNESTNNANDNYLYSKREQKEKAPPPSVVSNGSSISNDVVEIHQTKAVVQKNPLVLSPPSEFEPSDVVRHQRVSATGRPFVDGTVGFTFPILNSSNQKGINNKKTMIINLSEDPPRDSLEVYQPIHEKAVPRPTGPPIENYVPLHFSPTAREAHRGGGDDDAGSDASSDLFEIESFSTQTTTYPMYQRRDSLDDAPAFNARRFGLINGINVNGGGVQYGGRRSMEEEPPTPSVAGTECYPPSEVSIDWSVTTVEGFERASISASEMGSTAAFFRPQPPPPRVEEEVGKMRKGGNGGLLMMSCRQEKAVSVGPQPVKCVAAAEVPQIFPLHVGSRPPRANKPPIGSSHSARLSLAFAA